MSDLPDQLDARDPEARRAHIVETLVDAFSDLMAADPSAFRVKFRKMAADPYAFFRGSDCLFFSDLARLDDPWADEQTSREAAGLPDTCSPVGSGGQTGCARSAARAWAAERRAKANGQSDDQ